MINRSNLFRRAHALAHQIVSSCETTPLLPGVWRRMKLSQPNSRAEALILKPTRAQSWVNGIILNVHCVLLGAVFIRSQ